MIDSIDGMIIRTCACVCDLGAEGLEGLSSGIGGVVPCLLRGE